MEAFKIDFSFVERKTGIRYKKSIYDFSVNIFSQAEFNHMIDEVSWKHLNQEIIIRKYNELYEIKYACPVNQYILIIFKFKESTKLIIFDFLGNEIKDVNPPKLISKTAQLFNIISKISFNSVYWNNFNEKTPLIDIGFNNDYYEIRLFKITDFEFKECIQSGRI